MYKILSRERLGLKRYGRYIVEFSTSWPLDTRTLYLVSEFTSWHPGYIRLRKTGDRGEALVKVWDGVYHYMFVKNGYDYYVDSENPDRIEGFKPFPEVKASFTASIANIGVSAIEELLEEGGFHEEHIVHDEGDPIFLSRYLDYIVIRLRTLKGEVDRVLLKTICDGSRKTIVMEKVLSTRYHDYFEAIIRCNSLRGYMFTLEVDGKKILYGNEGVVENPSYIIPVRIKGVNSYQWYLGAIYYSIFVDSFARSNRVDKPSELIRKYAPRERGYYGGDLAGIIDKIDYIGELGVDAVYLTPIFESTTYHRYDVVDYYKVDKYLGGNETFKQLVEKLHERNIKIILDIPLHHTSVCFHGFRDALKKGEKSPYWNWYVFLKKFDEVPAGILEKLLEIVDSDKCLCREVSRAFKGLRPFYETFYGVWCMPKLNYDNAEVVDYMINVIDYWSNMGVDGFRLDVSLGVPANAMKALHRVARERNRILIGEVMTDPKYYLWEEQYDSAMNYELRRLILDYFYYHRMRAVEFAQKVMEQYIQLAPYKANALYNLVGSHDTIRIRTLVKNNEILEQIYAFLFTVYGSPAIYYGDEIGIGGGSDPDNRRPMPWNNRQWNKRLLNYIRKLIELKKKYRALRYGFFRIKSIGENIVVRRFLDDRDVRVVFNTSTISISFKLGVYDEVIYGKRYAVTNDNVEIEPRGLVFITKNM